VLNAPDRVKPETILSVRAAIDALGYRANRHARNLRTQTSKVIGYCLPALTATGNSVLDTFLHTLVESAEGFGYHTLLITAQDREQEIRTYEHLAATSAVDGIVFAQTTDADPRPAALRQMRLPFVSFGRTWGDLDHSWVDVDGAAGTRKATEHLLARGHQRFAWIAHEPHSVGTHERERGVIEAVQRAGFSNDAVHIIHAGPQDSGLGALRGALDSPDRPTAFIAGSDLQAITVLAELESRGLTPGRDAAVVGFDDSPVSAFAGGGLSSVRQPIATVTSELVRLLNDQFRDPGCAPEHILLEPELVLRRTA
jgi:DNA-binding LacI/PurR family transcriptional regulator